MDSSLAAGVLATEVLSATIKPIPVVGNGLGHAIEAFGKLLQAIEHNKQELKDFGLYVTNEQTKIKKAFDDAPADYRAELDARFAGIIEALDQATTDIAALGSQNLFKRVAVAQNTKDKLAEHKSRLQQEVLSFLTLSVHRVEENQRRERERLILQQLKPVISGTAEGKDAPAGCMEGTREQLLHDITEWANDPNGPCAFWLSGLAGTGKTTVASSIAEKLVKAGLVVVSFFISRHAGQRSDLYNIVHTLAFELARVNAAARTAILKAFERDPRLHELNLNEQVEHLLLEPLKAVSMANSDARIVLILDALDECDNPAALVGDGCLAKLIPALSCRDAIGKVKVLLTSRPMETIGNALHPFMLRLGREVKLHEIETLGDIHTYLERSMFDLCAHRQLPMSWPSADEISALVKRAGSLFIYAATVIRYISQDEYWPPERLTDLLSTQPASAEDDSPYEEVDKLYLEVMLLFIQRGNRGGSGKQTPLAERVRRVVAAVVLQREPMSPQLISALFHIPVGAVLAIVLGLSAIWSAPASETDRIVIYHESFPDFIQRCPDDRFTVTLSDGNEWLATGCLQVLNEQLVRDICQIPLTAGKPLPSRNTIPDIDGRLKRHVSAPLCYSSLHLLYHVTRSAPADAAEVFVDQLLAFCRERLFFWVELTCLLGSSTLSSLLVQLLTVPTNFLNSQRFAECGVLLSQLGQAIQFFEEPLQVSHAEVYSSFLAFMPRSELRATYTHLQCFIQIVQDKNRSYPAQRSLLPYHGHVESILTTAEGSTVACIWRKDAENTTQYIAVWLNATRTSFKHFIRVGTADKVLIAIDPSGKNLVVSKVCTNTDLTKISVWNFSGGKPVLIRARSVAGRVLAMSVDPSGMYVVYATPASAQSMVLPDLTDVIEDRHDFPRPIRLAAFSTDGQSFMAIDHMGEVTVRAGRAPWKSFQHCRPPPSTALPSQIKLHISPDGCTAIVSGPSDNPVDPVDVWIYRLPLAGQTELLSIQANVMKWVASSDASLIVIMQKEDDDWESPPFISVNRIKWQTRPHLQWIQGIFGEWFATLLGFAHSDTSVMIGVTKSIHVYNIATGEICYQHTVDGDAKHVTHLIQKDLLLVCAKPTMAHDVIDVVDIRSLEAVTVTKDPCFAHIGLATLLVQSPCGTKVASLEKSAAYPMAGRVWRLSTDGAATLSCTVNYPKLTGYERHAEFTKDGGRLLVMSGDGMAIVPIDDLVEAKTQYISLEVDGDDAWKFILSHDEMGIAVIHQHSVSVWDFPAFSHRRQNLPCSPDVYYSYIYNGGLLACQAEGIIMLADLSQENVSCSLLQLPEETKLEAMAFCTDSPLLVTILRTGNFPTKSHTARLWDLADPQMPVVVRSVETPYPALGGRVGLSSGGNFLKIYSYSSIFSKRALGEAPHVIQALGAQDDWSEVNGLNPPQDVAVHPTLILMYNSRWLSATIGTHFIGHAPTQQDIDNNWERSRPVLHLLCWLPEIYDDDAIMWYGARVFLCSGDGEVSIFDFSGHPLFQRPTTAEL